MNTGEEDANVAPCLLDANILSQHSQPGDDTGACGQDEEGSRTPRLLQLTSVFDEDVNRFGAMHHPRHAGDDFVQRLTAKTRRAAKIEPAARGKKGLSVDFPTYD